MTDNESARIDEIERSINLSLNIINANIGCMTRQISKLENQIGEKPFNKNQWIRTDKELPRFNVKILLFHDNVIEIGERWYEWDDTNKCDGWTWNISDRFNYMLIKYWMPLPNPPLEEI